jgi:glucose/arabinose dehydrogenase
MRTKGFHSRCAPIGAVCALAFALGFSVQAQARVGQQFDFKASDLPVPYSRPSVGAAVPEMARPDGAMPQVPKGFDISIFASGLDHPREMAVASDGTVFVSETQQDQVLALKDSDGDGKIDQRIVFADGFRDPTGLAVHDKALYIADRRAVWRIGFDGGTMRPLPRSMVTRVGALGSGGGHLSRELVFAPDGRHFFVAVGSATNVGEDPYPRATIQRFRADGHAQATYASGLRNPVGMAFYPGTDDLYTVVNERFGLGAGLVPDYFTQVKPGGFYGFPYAYLGAHPDPQFGDLRPDLVKASLVPDVLLAPHSGPMGLLFVQGKALPPDWQGDALVALHGTHANSRTAGYAIVRIAFEDGQPTGSYETVVAGFEVLSGQHQGVWGRPVWLAKAHDGSLLISDDAANVIWRLKWRKTPTVASAETLPRTPATVEAAATPSSH